MKHPYTRTKFRALLLILIFALFSTLLTACSHTHTIQTRETVPATCTSRGIKEEYCSKCDYRQELPILPFGHKLVEKTVTKASTCTEDGSAIYQCEHCQETMSRTLPKGHKFLTSMSTECTACGARRSDITPNNWYSLTTNRVVQAQNAELTNVSSMGGNAFLITYYPVCANCHICGRLEMVGVSFDSPVSENYYCDSCNQTTYANFRTQY